MQYRVDDILNGWFGEPPEHSENERDLLRYLYAPLRKLEDELRQAQAQLRAQSWQTAPDRSGGQFTQEELDNTTTWR